MSYIACEQHELDGFPRVWLNNRNRVRVEGQNGPMWICDICWLDGEFEEYLEHEVELNRRHQRKKIPVSKVMPNATM